MVWSFVGCIHVRIWQSLNSFDDSLREPCDRCVEISSPNRTTLICRKYKLCLSVDGKRSFGEILGTKTIDTRIGPHPNISFSVLEQGPNNVRTQAIFQSESASANTLMGYAMLLEFGRRLDSQ